MRVVLSLPLSGLAAFLFSNGLLPAFADEAGTADDIGIMQIDLQDAVRFNWGGQGSLQGAGTPNQAGIGGFLPLSVGVNSVFFLDAQVNLDFGDYSDYSSLVNTTVAGGTVSTSSRLGYRWLTEDRDWMFGFIAGYDSRPLKAGKPDTDLSVIDSQTVFYQQVAAGFEAVSPKWRINAYSLVPVGDVGQRLNSHYAGDALHTYGGDIGYYLTPEVIFSAGYYYQNGQNVDVDGSGVKSRIGFHPTNGVEFGVNYSYDKTFESRVSADAVIRFGGPSSTSKSKKQWHAPVIEALSSSPKNRDVRVADPCTSFQFLCVDPIAKHLVHRVERRINRLKFHEKNHAQRIIRRSSRLQNRVNRVRSRP